MDVPLTVDQGLAVTIGVDYYYSHCTNEENLLAIPQLGRVG